MTTTLRHLLSTVAFSLVVLPAMGAEPPDLMPFPEAAEGMTRFVVPLPQMARDEAHYAVELVSGRTITTDGVNQVRMDTTLEARTLEGWGYTYYEMVGSGQTSSTLMAVPPGTPEVVRFVGGQPLTVRYNSRLPVVIYAPAGFEVRYRIWAAAEEYLEAGPG